VPEHETYQEEIKYLSLTKIEKKILQTKETIVVIIFLVYSETMVLLFDIYIIEEKKS
jgi:hypothetical protein